MQSPLFRPEAQTRSRRTEGRVILRQPVKYKILVAILLTLTSGVCFLVAFGTYAKRFRTAGYVVTDLGIAAVRPPAGVLLRLDVVEGTRVERGQQIALISRTLVSGRDINADRLTLNELETLDRSLALQEAREQELTRRETELAIEERAVQEREQVIIEARRTRAETRLRLAEQRLTAAQDLREKKYISEFALLDHQDALLGAQSAVDDLNSALERSRYAQRELTLRAEAASLKLDTKLQDLKRQRAEFRQRILDIKSRSEISVVAPISGVVSAIRGHVGEALEGQSPLLTIFPDGGRLEIELYLTGTAVAMLQIGTEIVLRYPAFPHEVYGLQKGQVKEISEVTIFPEDTPNGLTLPNEPLFRVRVQPSTVSFRLGAEKASLRPGMLAEADILGERRALWEWMLMPLAKIRT